MRNDPLPLHDPGGLGIFNVIARALAPAPFEADYGAHWDRRDPSVSATAPPTLTTQGDLSPKRGLLARLEHWFWVQRQRDLEAYLAQSADIYELESRIRDLERTPLHPYY